MSANEEAALQRRLRENLATVRQRIDAARERAGRDDPIRLIAVTKYAPLEAVQALLQLGHRELGESRPQQLLERAAGFDASVEWHLIGHLQRNKVRSVLPVADWIHSVDSLRLLRRIGQIAGELQRFPRLLVQVNVSGEESKEGFSPEELRRQWPDLLETPNVRLCGLMTMAPLTEDQTCIRTVFRDLRLLRDELQEAAPEHRLVELSMGMSGDFEIAVEEGATMIRLGSVLFEEDSG